MPSSTILPLASDSDADFVQCLLEPVSRLKWLSLPIEMSDDWLGRRDVERPIELGHPDLKLGPLNIKAPGEISSMLCKESWYAGFIRAWKSEALEFVRVCVWAGGAPNEPILKNDESTL
jgi:hypothetical protein